MATLDVALLSDEMLRLVVAFVPDERKAWMKTKRCWYCRLLRLREINLILNILMYTGGRPASRRASSASWLRASMPSGTGSRRRSGRCRHVYIVTCDAGAGEMLGFREEAPRLGVSGNPEASNPGASDPEKLHLLSEAIEDRCSDRGSLER